MNTSHFVKLLILLVLIAGAGSIFLWEDRKEREEANEGSGSVMFPEFSLDKVVSVQVKDSTGELELALDEAWSVGSRWNHPTDSDKIGELLETVWQLERLRYVKAGPSQHGRLGLLPPGEDGGSGTLITFRNAEGTPDASLLLGKEYIPRTATGTSQDSSLPQGRYVMPDGKAEAISLVSDTFDSVTTDATLWLDKEFFKVDKLKSARVVHPDEADSWSVSRENDTEDMVLAELPEDRELDSTKSYSLKNILGFPEFDDVMDPETPESDSGMDNPVVATLETFDGFTYTIRIGKAQEDDKHPFSVQVAADIPSEREAEEGESEEDKQKLDEEFAARKATLEEKLEKESRFGNWLYLVPEWRVDTLLYKRADLLKEPEPEEPPAEEESDVTPEVTAPAPETTFEVNPGTVEDVENLIEKVIDPFDTREGAMPD